MSSKIPLGGVGVLFNVIFMIRFSCLNNINGFNSPPLLLLLVTQITVWSIASQTGFTQERWTTLGCCAPTRPPLPGTDLKAPPFPPEHGTSLIIITA